MYYGMSTIEAVAMWPDFGLFSPLCGLPKTQTRSRRPYMQDVERSSRNVAIRGFDQIATFTLRKAMIDRCILQDTYVQEKIYLTIRVAKVAPFLLRKA